MGDGRFIVFEGIDGSGTTTQTKLAAEWLRTKGIDVVETAEPTRGGSIGKLIRLALSGKFPGREGRPSTGSGPNVEAQHAVPLPVEGREIEPELFALLFAADRLDHMNALVVPALERGQWVVSDRCYLSSFAYQTLPQSHRDTEKENQEVSCSPCLCASVANILHSKLETRNSKLDWVRTLNRHARRADLILLLDMDARAAYERFAHERKNHEVFETVEKMSAIRANYLDISEILKREGEHIITIDAQKSIDAVASAAQEAISRLLPGTF